MPEVLVFPTSRGFLTPVGTDAHQNKLRLRGEWTMILKLWLEGSALTPSYDENLSRAKSEFPELSRRIDAAREETSRRGSASEPAFRLFRQTAAEIQSLAAGKLANLTWKERR